MSEAISMVKVVERHQSDSFVANLLEQQGVAVNETVPASVILCFPDGGNIEIQNAHKASWKQIKDKITGPLGP